MTILVETYSFALAEFKRARGHDAERKTGAPLSSTIIQFVFNI